MQNVTMKPWKRVVTTETELKSLTLPQTEEFQRSELNEGIIQAMVTVNRFFEVLPFQTCLKAPCDPYLAGAGNEVSEISSAAKRLGRGYMEDVAKKLQRRALSDSAAWGTRINFRMLEWLTNQVDNADFFMAHGSTLRDVYSLFRADGDVVKAWKTVMELPSGHTIPEYSGIPIFRNDFMSERKIVIGRFDDAEKRRGVYGLIPETGFIEVDRSGPGWLLSLTADFRVSDENAVAGLCNVGRW